MKDHLKVLEDFTKDIGVDLSVWELTHQYLDDSNMYDTDDDVRIIEFECKTHYYSMYVVMQNFKGEQWKIIEFSIAGD